MSRGVHGSSRVETSGVHGSGQVSLWPSSNPIDRCQVERRVTRNQPPASIGWVGFGFGWRSVLFGRFRVVPEAAKSSPKNVKTHQICIKIIEICTKIAEILWEWPDLAKSHQIWLRTHWISSDLSLISDLYITFVGSSGSGFGEENPPLNLPASGLGRGNPKPTDGSVGSGWTRVEIGRVGQSSGSQLGLDTPSNVCYFELN